MKLEQRPQILAESSLINFLLSGWCTIDNI